MRTLTTGAALVLLAGCFGGGEAPAAMMDAGQFPVFDAGEPPPPPDLDGGRPIFDAGRPPPMMMPSPVDRDDISEVCAPEGFCWELPHPQGHDVRAMWGAAADDAWAVGEGGLLLHYDGERFEYHDAMSDGMLRSIHGRAADDVWAVGDEGLVAHYDGDTWSSEILEGFDAKKGDAAAALYGVWAADGGETVAVGHNGNRAIVAVHDGKGWSIADTLPRNQRLRAVWGLSASDVWAVGDGGTLLSYDGAEWTAAITPTGVDLYSVHALNGELWAAGNGGAVLKYDGMLWSVETLDGMPDLRVIRVDGPGPWAFGEAGAVFRRQGGEWSALSSGQPTRDFWGAWRIAKERLLAVGDHGLVQSWDDDTRQTLSFGPTGNLLGIWGDNRGLWVVGDDLLLRDSLGWIELDNPSSRAIFDVWGRDDEIWAVGTGGTVLQYLDGQWADVSPPEAGQALLYGVWSNGTTTLVVGESGMANRLIGDTWTGAPVSAFVDFFDVWGTDDNNAYAVGESGLVMHWNGSSWQTEPVVTPGVTTLRGVWGSDADDVFVVGDFGTVLHYDGSVWEVQDADTGASLRAVHGTGPDDVWAVGGGGTIIHYDGEAWKSVQSGTIRSLEAVWTESNGGVWAVGRDGTVLVKMP